LRQGGITAGRFFISHLGARFGEKLFVYALVAGAVVLQLLVWLIPNVVGESVAVALLGLLLGPVRGSSTSSEPPKKANILRYIHQQQSYSQDYYLGICRTRRWLSSRVLVAQVGDE
jgi:hypothetical protein